MEIYKIIVICVVVSIICVGSYLAITYQNKKDKERIYVYPKTKNKYIVKGIVKMKDTLTLEWVDAILYISLKNGNYYVREEKQFFDKFITLKDWEKQGGKVK